MRRIVGNVRRCFVLRGAMIISLFKHKGDNEPTHHEIEWEAFATQLKHTVRAQKDGPLWSPTRFHGTRSNVNAMAVSAGVLDYDGTGHNGLTEAQLGDAIARIVASGLECVVHTTYSDKPGARSLRVIVPYSRPVDALHHHDVREALNKALGGYSDVVTKDAARFYYLPSHPPTSRPGQVSRIRGAPWNPDALPAPTPPPPTPTQPTAPAPGIITHGALKALVLRMKRRGAPTAEVLQLVLDGEPWAEPGLRDTTLFHLSAELAREFPTVPPEAFAPFFRASLQVMTTHLTEADVIDKIRRRQNEATEKVQEQRQKREYATSQAIRRGFQRAGIDRNDPYTEAEKAAVNPRRWIMQRAQSFYFLTLIPHARYLGPYTRDEAQEPAQTILAPAGLQLDEMTEDGTRQRTITELTAHYGSTAEASIVDMAATSTHLEETEGRVTIVEACAPVRKVQAIYHPAIGAWLKDLAQRQYHHLEQWIAWFADLTRPAVALLATGPRDVGKTLLADGLARRWTTGGPTDASQVLHDGFNEGILQCPLVLADEWLSGEKSTARLRQMIQARTRPLRRKYMPDARIKGSIRLIITANNTRIIEEDHLTAHDSEAIQQRIFHLPIPQAMSGRLRNVDTSQWVRGDMIAQHAAWIIANVEREANPPRFLIEPEPTDFHASLSTSTHNTSHVAHWLVAALLDRFQKMRVGRPANDSCWAIQVIDGALWVNPRTIVEHWEAYPTNVDTRLATVARIGAAVRALSDTTHDQRRPMNVAVRASVRPKGYRIRTADLVAWANTNGFAGEEDITTALAAPPVLHS